MDINISNPKKINFDLSFLRAFYRDYKDNILPIGVILICILMIFFVIIPEFKQYLNSREQLKEETKKQEVLKNNYNFLLSLNDNKSDSDLKTLSQALPSDKDFVGMMSAITIAASKIGLSVENFNFSLGDLSKVDSNVSEFPFVIINISLGGDVKSISKFITELYKTVPASEVVNIKSTVNVTSLAINFYYKPFSPQNLNETAPIVPLSSKDSALLKDVSSWNRSDIEAFLPIIQSTSSSANPSPF